MDPDGSSGEIVALLILLFLSGFFSASETALMSLSKIRIRNMVEENVKGAKTIQKLVDNPSKLLGTILIGNNIVNIGASALATSIAIEHFGNDGVGIATGIMTVLVLIFGEIAPKSLAVQNSEVISLKVAKTIYYISCFLNPVVKLFTKITNLLIKPFGGDAEKNKPFLTEDELKTMVDVSEKEGILEIEEKEMIYNVFEFGDLKVKEVMVQRMDISAVDISTTYEELIEFLKQERFSRIPVYDETIDNIVGIFYVKDLVFLNENKENFNIKDFMREPFFTFEFKKIAELFNEMKKSSIQMAVVLDEYGGVSGIVTMEDMIEEIFGDIQDEYDDNEKEIDVVEEDEYIVTGNARIDMLNNLIGTKLESEEFESIGGFVIGQVGRIPKAGETIEYSNIKFIVEDVDKNRIRTIRILT